MIRLLKLLCWINWLFHWRKFQYSQEIEGNAGYMSTGEKLWWAHKHYLKPVEMGEKGKDIEEYFRKQDLNFTLPQGFEEAAQISFTAGGDIMASHHVRTDNTFNLWDEAEDFLFDADICCANLETPVVPSQTASFVTKNVLKTPVFNYSPEVFDLFYKEGKRINFFSTANNHCLDMGKEGLLETLEFLDKKGCPYVGTARSPEQRDALSIVEKNGVRVAFLSYTFSTNGKPVPEGESHLVNYIRLNQPDCDISLIEKHVHMAKTEKKADIVIACLHWSLEFESYPIQNIIDMGHKLMSLGIDVIVGNHPHGIQPMEKYTFLDPFSGIQKQGLIIYALGDLISCHEHIPNSRLNNLVRLNITKGSMDGKPLTVISDLKIRPMYIYSKMDGDQCVDFRLLHFTRLMNEIKEDNNRMNFDKKSLKELKRLEALVHKLLHKEIMSS